ncbi:MAG: DUF6498-containing protein [Alphaproteobacteria bacterium]
MDLAKTMAGLERGKRWGEGATALVFNLIPIFGVLFWHWSAFALIFLYWSENVVIGVRTLLCLFVSAAFEGLLVFIGMVPLAIFFCVHYGMFCFVHGVFIVGFFSGAPFYDAFDLPSTVGVVFARAPNIIYGFLSIVFWQVVQFVLFLVRGEAKTAKPMDVMASPYPRIVALHVAIMGGGFLVMLLGQPVWALLVLALFKTAYDVAGPLGVITPVKPTTTNQLGARGWAPREGAPQG